MTLKNNYLKSWMITFCISNISFKQLKTFQQCTSKWNLFNLMCHRVTQSFMYRVKKQSRAFHIINKADVHVHSFYYKSFLPAVLYIVIMSRKSEFYWVRTTNAFGWSWTPQKYFIQQAVKCHHQQRKEKSLGHYLY